MGFLAKSIEKLTQPRLALGIVVVVVAAVLPLSGWLLTRQPTKPIDLTSIPDHSIITWQLNGQELQVEVVNTPASIQQGLGGREKLDIDDVGTGGMLFVFSEPGRPIFWMKDMRFAIDIIWLNEGEIVGIDENVQPPAAGTPDSQLETFPAPRSVDMALEMLPGKLD